MGPGGKGFQIEYPKITLHAISRGSGGASIYCQLDEQPGGAAEAPEDEDSEMSELNIYPGDANAGKHCHVSSHTLQFDERQ